MYSLSTKYDLSTLTSERNVEENFEVNGGLKNKFKNIQHLVTVGSG